MGSPAYDRENTRRINLKLNNKTDADIILWLESQESIQGSIKRLIRAEISSGQGEWIEEQDDIVCSECGRHFKSEIRYLACMGYCPCCGAKMN